MPRIPYAAATHLEELRRQAGFPDDTPPTNAFRMLAHTPAVGASALRLVLALLTETGLDPKLREMVILRVIQCCEGRYARTQHVAIAKSVGVSDVQIAMLERGDTPADLFSDRERAVFAFADENLRSCSVADETFAAVRELFSPREIVELTILIGYFRMISALLTTLDVEVESPFGLKILEAVRSKRNVNTDRLEWGAIR